MLLLQDSGRQRTFVIIREDRYSFLHNDWAMIEFFVHKVNSTTCDLNAVCKCLLLRFKPWKSRQ